MGVEGSRVPLVVGNYVFVETYVATVLISVRVPAGAVSVNDWGHSHGKLCLPRPVFVYYSSAVWARSLESTKIGVNGLNRRYFVSLLSVLGLKRTASGASSLEPAITTACVGYANISAFLFRGYSTGTIPAATGPRISHSSYLAQSFQTAVALPIFLYLMRN